MSEADIEVLRRLVEYFRVKIDYHSQGVVVEVTWEVLLWANSFAGAKQGRGASLSEAGEAAMRQWED